jgi:hypothetical protein
MFRSICVNQQIAPGGPHPFDLGFLAEALLFYDDARLIANINALNYLVRSCGPDTVIALLEEGFLKLTYTQTATAVQTDSTGTPHERHRPIIVSSVPPELLQPGQHTARWSLEEAAQDVFQEKQANQDEADAWRNASCDTWKPIAIPMN